MVDKWAPQISPKVLSNVILEFDAIVRDSYGDTERMTIGVWNFKSFKKDVLDGTINLIEIEQDEYSSAFLPSWVMPAYESNFDDKRNVAIFLRYCELFDAGKILFGVQTKNIASIKLVLS